MEKIKEIIKKFQEKFKSLSKGVKISLIIALVALVVGIISFSFYSSKNKYGILFSDLEASDAQTITAKLKEAKVDMKIDGQSILVPKEKVSELRLELATEIKSGSKGYELMDGSSSFGMTDEEFQVKKIRMLQGELEKTIKSFSQIEAARVHITPAQSSVFVKDKTPGKAAVYIQLKAGKTLENDQVKSIVALVSGSTENIPNENVEVMDSDMNLLSKGLFDDNGVASSTSVDKQRAAEKQFEKELQQAIIDLYEPVLGKGKISAQVNADLDFDSTSQTQLVIDPNKVIVSQETSKDVNQNGTTTNGASPVDNNSSNTIDTNNGSGTSSSEKQTTNYESGRTETKTIKAEGGIRRVTASVMIDGNLDAATQEQMSKSIANAIGLKADRGDEISVVGMTFDPAANKEAKAQLDAMQEEIAKQERMTLIRNIAIGAGIGIVAIVAAIIFFRKRRKKDEAEEPHILDIVVGEQIKPKEPVVYDPIDFEPNDETSHIESEVKKYAKEKPEQVVEILKSWLNERER
ncbi:flagellar basal-body MS-ring/collar protein FliF [Clostridium intestinale]|uniref:flagellar basal-body MS-ring/collar protein FliF n=1 Tax=Clostridium intestinale TaxID=36845 RepID=UPI002DD6524B|nr:flagellar basal-body MS-ring/collar protein FliF [Clostridium intestinale]WRY53832.1 flagellar basal-body MS-ring/collar protein FliF [Clostridium intestinale]